MTDITREETEALQVDLEANKRRKDKLKSQLDKIEESIWRIELELDRRALEAYWKAHPELLPLNVGDKLLMTQEFLDRKLEIVGKIQMYYGWELGKECAIETIDLKGFGIRYDHAGLIHGGDLELAQSMRAAYLASEAAKS